MLRKAATPKPRTQAEKLAAVKAVELRRRCTRISRRAAAFAKAQDGLAAMVGPDPRTRFKAHARVYAIQKNLDAELSAFKAAAGQPKSNAVVAGGYYFRPGAQVTVWTYIPLSILLGTRVCVIDGDAYRLMRLDLVLLTEDADA